MSIRGLGGGWSGAKSKLLEWRGRPGGVHSWDKGTAEGSCHRAHWGGARPGCKPSYPIGSQKMENQIMFRQEKMGEKGALFYYYHYFPF